MPVALDIVIPVYNEGDNIAAVLGGLQRDLKTPARILICYDMPDDNTLPAVRANPDWHRAFQVEFVRNTARGVHNAIMAGFAASRAPLVVVFPADDDFNAGILDRMVDLARADRADACDIVCASRFMPGGTMQGCPWLKAFLVRTAAFTLFHLAHLPTRDPTSGFRLFSRRVIDRIRIESDQGFCYSIELLVKAHRLGWRVGEVPARWFERKHGTSRFRVLKWLPAYLRWYRYAFATTWLRRSGATVELKS